MSTASQMGRPATASTTIQLPTTAVRATVRTGIGDGIVDLLAQGSAQDETAVGTEIP
jgi:hypothetical protein